MGYGYKEVFKAVHKISVWNLDDQRDEAFLFDYDGSGKLDHLCVYRPGTGAIFILKRVGDDFTPVFAQGDPGAGIGGFPLNDGRDTAFAFDYDGSGKLDHLLLYRPGTGMISILRRAGGDFTPVYSQGDPGQGIGGYKLDNDRDSAFTIDFDGSGKLDHLAFHREPIGTPTAFWILQNNHGTWSPVLASNGTDPFGAWDRIFAFDFKGTGKYDHIFQLAAMGGYVSITERVTV